MGRLWLVVCALLAFASPAQAGIERRSYADGYHAVVYTPDTVTRPAPLVVFLHGCNQTAEHVLAEGDLSAQAEAGGFVALLADFDASRRATPCWRFRSDTTRASADPAAVAAMVSDALGRGQLDPARVYAAGLSSGAMMTAVLGATYPDLFAGIAIDAGCAYRAVTCIGAGPSRSTQALAQAAVRAMGPRRRVMPVLILHGDQDATVPVSHSRQVLEQWRRTDNLVATGDPARPLAGTPSRVRRDWHSTVESYDDQRGRTVLERWTLHGWGHDWLARSDARPGAATAMWSFFSRLGPMAGISAVRRRS